MIGLSLIFIGVFLLAFVTFISFKNKGKTTEKTKCFEIKNPSRYTQKPQTIFDKDKMKYTTINTPDMFNPKF